MLTRIIRKVKREALSFLIGLFIEKKDRKVFFKARDKEIERIKKVPEVSEEFIVHDWRDTMDAMKKYLVNGFSYNFLKHPLVGGTMFLIDDGFLQKGEIQYLEKVYSKDFLKKVLKEVDVGKPTLTSFKYLSSTNSVHLLHHFAKFSKELGLDVGNTETVVEFGGGYGNAARIFKRLNPNVTYIIIDIPTFSSIQSIYLETILSESELYRLEGDFNIAKGKINVLDFSKENVIKLKEKVSGVDLFLSTWALSESPLLTQKLIQSQNFFDAAYLLMAHQKNNASFVDAERIVEIGSDYQTLYHKQIELQEESSYLFCKKR